MTTGIRSVRRKITKLKRMRASQEERDRKSMSEPHSRPIEEKGMNRKTEDRERQTYKLGERGSESHGGKLRRGGRLSDLEGHRQGQGKCPQEGGKLHRGASTQGAWWVQKGKWEADGGSWRDQQGEDKVTKWTMEWGSG